MEYDDDYYRKLIENDYDDQLEQDNFSEHDTSPHSSEDIETLVARHTEIPEEPHASPVSASGDLQTITQVVEYASGEVYQEDSTGTVVQAVFKAGILFLSAFHLINGVEYLGLLLDPGASKGIIGTDTFQKIITHILRPRRLDRKIVWTKSVANFSGISSNVQRSLSLVAFPIGLAGISNSSFTCDLLGGQSSQCPGLMPLHSLVAAGAMLLFGCFPNGDGIVAFQDAATQRLCPQKVYLTDTGHYLLSIDQFDKPFDKQLARYMEKHFTHRLAGTPGYQSVKGKGRGKFGNAFLLSSVDAQGQPDDLGQNSFEVDTEATLDKVFQ